MKEAAEPANTMSYGFGVWNRAFASIEPAPNIGARRRFPKLILGPHFFEGRAARRLDGQSAAPVVSKTASQIKFIALFRL